jgi:hypothetical protein
MRQRFHRPISTMVYSHHVERRVPRHVSESRAIMAKYRSREQELCCALAEAKDRLQKLHHGRAQECSSVFKLMEMARHA